MRTIVWTIIVSGVCSACKTPEAGQSTVKTTLDIPDDQVGSLVDPADVKAFIAHAAALAAGTSGTPSLSVGEFTKVMPMAPDQRTLLEQSYTTDFTTTCDSSGLCQVADSGAPVKAVLNVTVPLGFVSLKNPVYSLDDHVGGVYRVSSDQTSIDFCHLTGMTIIGRVGFVTQTKQLNGLRLSFDSQAHLAVAADDDTVYTCQ